MIFVVIKGICKRKNDNVNIKSNGNYLNHMAK